VVFAFKYERRRKWIVTSPKSRLLQSQLDQPQVVKPGVVFKDCAKCPEMVVIPAGNFLMGGLSGWSNDSLPVHEVRLNSFAIGKFEVTQKEWNFLMGNNPSVTIGDDLPVNGVSWNTAKDYVKKLSERTGKNYRLPSESEWEYASKGIELPKDQEALIKVINVYSWNGYNSKKEPHSVGKKSSNLFGLHDIFGNVVEWVEDCKNPNFVNAPNDGSPWLLGSCNKRVLRGGSYNDFSAYFYKNFRMFESIDSPFPTFGFRVARDF
jgi:formylglycine-generating enzyme required for sulfatase activity